MSPKCHHFRPLGAGRFARRLCAPNASGVAAPETGSSQSEAQQSPAKAPHSESEDGRPQAAALVGRGWSNAADYSECAPASGQGATSGQWAAFDPSDEWVSVMH